jgi:hypothetical protein
MLMLILEKIMVAITTYEDTRFVRAEVFYFFVAYVYKEGIGRYFIFTTGREDKYTIREMVAQKVVVNLLSYLRVEGR